MQTALLRTTLFILVAAFLSGCGSSSGKLSSSNNSNDGTTTTPDTTTPTSTWPFSVAGDVVAFSPVSWQEMNNYVGIRPLNNPSNPMVNISLQQVSGLNIYSGTVRIGYTDTNGFNYGEFTVGSAKNTKCDNCSNNNDYEAGYNYWTTINGVRTFMAYFQDQYGAILLVLEDSLGSGDASGSTLLNGRIFYRNFAQSLYPQSPYRKCWYITSGPYACYSSVMREKSSSTSIDGYTLLGSFTGVQSSKVFQ